MDEKENKKALTEKKPGRTLREQADALCEEMIKEADKLCIDLKDDIDAADKEIQALADEADELLKKELNQLWSGWDDD